MLKKLLCLLISIVLLSDLANGDICTPNPCQNGATCLAVSEVNFVCSCTSNCYGFDCSYCIETSTTTALTTLTTSTSTTTITTTTAASSI